MGKGEDCLMCYAGGPYCDREQKNRYLRAKSKDPDSEETRREQFAYYGTQEGQKELSVKVQKMSSPEERKPLVALKRAAEQARKKLVEDAKARERTKRRMKDTATNQDLFDDPENLDGVLVLTHGLPGSGKSTWAQEQQRKHEGANIVRANRDDIRTELFGADYHKGPPDPASEDQVTKVQRAIVKKGMAEGKPVIVDDTNLNVHSTKMFSDLIGKDKVKHVYFDVPYAECLRRNANRDRVVPTPVMESMSRNLREDGRMKRAYRKGSNGFEME